MYGLDLIIQDLLAYVFGVSFGKRPLLKSAIKYIDFNKAYVYFRNLPSIMKSVQKLLKNNKDA
jgi:hypothetical protein